MLSTISCSSTLLNANYVSISSISNYWGKVSWTGLRKFKHFFWQFGEILSKFYPGTNLVDQYWSRKLILFHSPIKYGFWPQNLSHFVSFWLRKFCWPISTFSGARNWRLMSVSGPRNWTILSVSGTRKLADTFLQFLGPETEILRQFLAPETEP